jgi:hypothetical protein
MIAPTSIVASLSFCAISGASGSAMIFCRSAE